MLSQANIKMSAIEKTIMALSSALYDSTINDLLDKNELRDALSDGQLISKAWLIEQFSVYIKNAPRVAICAGWFGFLARALYESDPHLHITSLDLNTKATQIAGFLLHNRGRALTQNIMSCDYSQFDCVINTSLEHIPSTQSWMNCLKSNCFVIVQSNNATYISEHINCHTSLQNLVDDLNLTKVLFAGQLNFKMYDRFMVIGQK